MNFVFDHMLFEASAAAAGSGEQVNGTAYLLVQLVPLVLLFVFLYFIMIRPQKKKEKEAKEMRDNLQIGDEVTTIGGIIGIVVRKDEKTGTVVIETGGDRSKIRVKTWAISENNTVHDIQEESAKK